MHDLTHFDQHGQAQMVDVGAKACTQRQAIASGKILMQPTTLARIQAGQAAKGEVLGVARIAAIMAAKRTSELIPLCHPLALTHIAVEFTTQADGISVQVIAATNGPTGVEMEALTAVHIALLTIYDMCKAVDRSMQMSSIRLLEKQGGNSGNWVAPGALVD